MKKICRHERVSLCRCELTGQPESGGPLDQKSQYTRAVFQLSPGPGLLEKGERGLAVCLADSAALMGPNGQRGQGAQVAQVHPRLQKRTEGETVTNLKNLCLTRIL